MYNVVIMKQQKKSKKIETQENQNIVKVVGVVILLFIIFSVIGSAKETNIATENAQNAASGSSGARNNAEENVEEGKVGVPVRDGKFEFTVKSINCGVSRVGTNEYLMKTPQGQYCLLNLSVKNIGNQAQSLLSSNQKLLSDGKTYSADDTATLYAAATGSSTWYTDINPGNSVEGVIVFDLPKDVTPRVANLHDSAFSSGVIIKLQ